jgi:anti-anti-sigma regulatory factor
MIKHSSEIGVERLGALTLFDIRGYVSIDAGPAIEDAYKIIDPERAKKILIRFDEDTYFNSEGIKSILLILAEARKNDQQVGITGLSEHFKKIFHMVGITKLATVFEGEDKALRGLDLEESNIRIPAFAGALED